MRYSPAPAAVAATGLRVAVLRVLQVRLRAALRAHQVTVLRRAVHLTAPRLQGLRTGPRHQHLRRVHTAAVQAHLTANLLTGK